MLCFVKLDASCLCCVAADRSSLLGAESYDCNGEDSDFAKPNSAQHRVDERSVSLQAQKQDIFMVVS